MIICRALIKYNYSSFRLEILEYCEEENIVDRENYYIELLNPSYNIVKKSYTLPSRLGYVHTKATIDKISESQLNRITISVKDTLTNTEKSFNSMAQTEKI